MAPWLVLSVVIALASPAAAQPPREIVWVPFSNSIFQKAQDEHRFILIDMEAVWCHWCHVMDEQTYRDPKVIQLIGSKYIAVRVDQDSDPELSARYENWGWPATVVLAPDGTEIVKRRGFIPPARMASMLAAIIKDPTPGPSVSDAAEIDAAAISALPAEVKRKLKSTYADTYDAENGGWGQVHKLIEAHPLEYALAQSRTGDALAAKRAQKTLDQGLLLIDPQWGGMYQYSDSVDWRSPHFEKIMSVQTEALRVYTLAYAQWNRPEYLRAAQDIDGFLKQFLTAPEGAFFTSEDADLSAQVDGHAYFKLADLERRKLGVPRIDSHIYSRENGWAISALTSLYDVTGDTSVLTRARTAANWIIANRTRTDGGFRHGAETDSGGLGDSLAMGQAFLNLYASTSESEWLSRAEKAADFVQAHFEDSRHGGYVATLPAPGARGALKRPVKSIAENVELSRFANLLFQYNGRAAYRRIAEQAMRYLAAPALAEQVPYLPGVLLADQELATEPIHVTVVGPQNDAAARALYLSARHYPAAYKRTNWWDPKQAPPPNLTVQFPRSGKSAAFACSKDSCSLPVTDPAQLANAVNRLLGRSAALH